MYVITDKAGVIIHISETIGYQENGNPLVDHGMMAIAEVLVGEVSEDIPVPEGVGVGTHTYRDGVFAEITDTEAEAMQAAEGPQTEFGGAGA